MKLFNKQVNKEHYSFDKYMHKERWASAWYQLDEVIKLNPKTVLEVGPGAGVFKAAATCFGLKVETLDIDSDLEPDHIGSVFEMPFSDGAFDVVCAFQMLEHLPFDESLLAFQEMSRVARTAVILSLPNASKRYPWSLSFPLIGVLKFSIPRPRLRPRKHLFDGEHYWELNKFGYSFLDVTEKFLASTDTSLVRSFRVDEFPYHHYLVFKCNK